VQGYKGVGVQGIGVLQAARVNGRRSIGVLGCRGAGMQKFRGSGVGVWGGGRGERVEGRVGVQGVGVKGCRGVGVV
jgi:hypothetical protein